MQATPADPPQTLLTVTVVESGGGTVQPTGDLASLNQPIAVVPDVTIDPTVRAVEIDIKPGAFPNVINLGSAGTIPVAIISTVAFDALTVDPRTIALHSLGAPGSPNVKLGGKGSKPLCSAEDVNGDGRLDLLCHVLSSALPLAGESVAVLDALSYPVGGPPEGIPISGADFVKIVP